MRRQCDVFLFIGPVSVEDGYCALDEGEIAPDEVDSASLDEYE